MAVKHFTSNAINIFDTDQFFYKERESKCTYEEYGLIDII